MASLRGPWLTALPLLVLLPFSLSAAVRFTLGWGLGGSLALMLLVSALGIAAAVRFGLPRVEPARTPHAALATLVLALGLVALTFRLWWAPPQHALPNTLIGVDVGNHVVLYQKFIHGDPNQYEGFLGMYAVMHWYRELLARGASPSGSVWYALRFAHYAYLLAVPVALALVSYPLLAAAEGARRVWALALGSALPMTLVLAGGLFPALAYYAAEGFYAQIAGLYPLVFAWIFYGLIERPEPRFVIACAWLVIQRFTYGLNLGDAFLVMAYLAPWDALQMRVRWLRWGALLFVPVASFVGYSVYVKLLPMRSWGGYYVSQDVPWISGAELLLSIALLVAPSLFATAQVPVSAASARLWRYAGTFGFVNAALTLVYFARGEPHGYYILKYGLYAVVLVLLASVGPVVTFLAHVSSGALRLPALGPSMRLGLAMAAVGTLAGIGVARGYRPYRALALERYRREVPNTHLFSDFDPEADAFMQRMLAQHQAGFGGYFDSYWPRMFVHNASFALFTEHPGFVYQGKWNNAQQTFVEQPGHCYFVHGELDWYRHVPVGTPMRTQMQSLLERADDCTSYVPSWGTNAIELCGACL